MKANCEKDFWSKVRKRRNGCWEWVGTKDKAGYGRFSFKNSGGRSHRVSWILANGEIPKSDGHHGTCVLHKCDNPSCVNPDHLFLGSQFDNIKDRDSKNRLPDRHGENASASKLTSDQVSKIRIMYGTNTYTKAELGRLFNITRSNIFHIVKGVTW